MSSRSDEIREMLRAYFKAWMAGDHQTFRDFYADDIEVHLFGQHPLAGTYIGKEALYGYQKKMAEICTSWTLLDVEDYMASDTRVATMLKYRFTRDGKEPLEITRLAIYVFRDNKISETWGYDPDPERVNAFFS